MNDMRHEKLIVRFLKAAASPAGVMRCKHTFSWLEISFLFMFLTACLTAPVSIA
jgi:maltodextrin utilization protein YvdJ